MVNNNEALLSSFLALVRRSNARALSYAMVMDAQGKILAHSNSLLAGQRPSDPLTLKALDSSARLRQESGPPGDRLIDISLPIYMEGRRIGTARIAYQENATNRLVDEILAAARRRIAAAAALCLLAGIIGAVFMSYFVSKPIKLLEDGARRIGAGALDHRIKITSRDELGDLAKEFNIMAAKLQELDQLKQDFVSNVTHELRSPLTSLRGYVEFLLRGSAGPLNDEQTDFLIVVKNNSVRLARFIDNLLDVAKIESKKIELHREKVSLSALAKEMIVVFRPQALEKEITLVNEIPEALSPLWADADKLSEIFTNLLSNAFKFTSEKGTVKMIAREEGDTVHISIQDDGVGIPPAALQNVFNKFEQVKPTVGLVRKTKGTGLGLTIVKGFVEAHGGKVWIESALNKGTTVHFTLAKSRPEEDRFTYEDDENLPGKQEEEKAS